MNVELFGTNVRFDDPWVFALALVALAGFAVNIRRARASGGGLLFSSVAILPPTRTSLRVRLRWALLPVRVVAVLLLIVALARPLVAHAAIAEGIDIAIAIDISSSMGAKDFDGATRIEGVKKVTHDFIGGLKNDRVGIVAFQAEAVELGPLTLDYAAAQRLADSLEAGGLRLRGGTAIGLGIAGAVDVLRQAVSRSKVVILLTDGENNSGEITPLDAAQVAKLLDVRVYTIGAVPTAVGGRQGAIEVDERQMRQISAMTGGEYYRASDKSSLLSIYQGIATLEKSRLGPRGYTDYEELYWPFLAAGATLLMLEVLLSFTVFRRVP